MRQYKKRGSVWGGRERLWGEGNLNNNFPLSIRSAVLAILLIPAILIPAIVTEGSLLEVGVGYLALLEAGTARVTVPAVANCALAAEL